MENGKNSKSIRMLEVLSILLLKEAHVYEIILKNSYSENKFYFIIFYLLYCLGCSLIFSILLYNLCGLISVNVQCTVFINIHS